MTRDEASLVLLVAAGGSVVALAFAAASLLLQRSMSGMMGGGGMHDGGAAADPGRGGWEWLLLVVATGLFVSSLLVFSRTRTRLRDAPSGPAPALTPPDPAPHAPRASPDAARGEAPVTELALVRFLDEDERRMYLEIRDRGGGALQRDLVALGMFSKAKVTRVLDRLEAKGLVVRERSGMTNRVRIVATTTR